MSHDNHPRRNPQAASPDASNPGASGSGPSNQVSPGISRRSAIAALGAGAVVSTAALGGAPSAPTSGKPAPARDKSPAKGPWFRISLAQWSLHRPLYAGEIDNLDFASEARSMGIGAIEYVNQFFKDHAIDDAYLDQMNARAADHDVKQLLIMVDGEGRIGAPDAKERTETVDNHLKWLHAAKRLGCHAIRVNAASEGSFDEQQKLAADGLRRLAERAEPLGLSVLVENHGGLSSHGGWLAGVMKLVDHTSCGTLPDFGNFCMDWSRADDPDAWYDRYEGTRELMPYAKAVSAKSYKFDDKGAEQDIDYARMLRIVRDAGYRGWVGIEYEGDLPDPREGIRLTKALLERVRGS